MTDKTKVDGVATWDIYKLSKGPDKEDLIFGPDTNFRYVSVVDKKAYDALKRDLGETQERLNHQDTYVAVLREENERLREALRLSEMTRAKEALSGKGE